MSTTFAQEQAFAASVSLSEGIRQADAAAGRLNLTGANLQTALRSADRAHHARVVAAAGLNSMTAPNHHAALVSDPAPQEAFTRSDTTAMILNGGRYIVAVAGTFGGGGGTVILADAAGNVFATFTDNGIAVVDLRYGTYAFALTNVTGLTATVKTGTY
jgi:hypothetical protein